MPRIWAPLLLAAALAVGPLPAIAQEGQESQPGPQVQMSPQAPEGEAQAPAYVSAVDGTARIDRGGTSEAIESGMPVVAGDRLRTESGRLELTFSDGSLVHLDRYADVDLAADNVLRLSRGRLLATIFDLSASTSARLIVEAPGASVRFDQPGQYRLAVGGTDVVEVELAVLRGRAQLASQGGNISLNAGEQSLVRDGQAPTAPQWVNASGETALERWAAERVATWQAPSTSQNYLPAELDSYGSTFDQYGTWQVDATYGSVWYPTVAVGWRPYYKGRWHHAPRYGWTWIAHDPWGWPTHHYGRWHVNTGGNWFWIPSHRWGAAWVYWAVSPGYIGWCPLGWNGYPVINVFTNYGHRYPYRRDPWRAWTFVSNDHFGRGNVPAFHVNRTRLNQERPAFVMQHRPPGFAPPRSPYGRYAEGAAPTRRPGMSTMAPRANRTNDAFPEGWTTRNPGTAVPRASTTTTRPGMSSRPLTTPSTPDDNGDRPDSPYERARPFMNPRNQAAPWRSPNPPTNRRDDDSGPPYVRPTDPGPRYTPRSRDDDGRGPGGGGAVPRRAPDSSPSSPGMSRPSDSGSRPGMSGPPSGHARPRGGDDGGGSRGGDGGSRGSSSRSSSGDGGGGSRGAVRRHP
jgi:hypothetical protein